MTCGYATAAMTLSSIAISVGNARADPGEEKQIADALCVRERANWFRRARTFEGFAHLSVTVIGFGSKFEFKLQNLIR